MAEETNVKPEQKPEEGLKVKTRTKEKEAILKPANCMKCNKHLQRKSWYYRNNAYYCSKRCWKLAAADAKKKEKKES